MKIAHVCLASSFTDGMMYQENFLSQCNLDDGHEVILITNCNKFVDGKMVETHEEDNFLPCGARLIRLEYDHIINKFVSSKIQKASRLPALLKELRPDVILYHGVNGYEMMDVAAYVRDHPQVLFYMDQHATFENSARTWFARMCYKFIHGYFVRRALPEVRKILCVVDECEDYLENVYGLPRDIMELYPLGGLLIDEAHQKQARASLLETLHLPQESIICAHSGKLSVGKRTREFLEAFASVSDERLQLLVFGSIPEEQRMVLEPLLAADTRVHFLGWKSNKEVTEILAGTDLYCQPGTQSSTFQTALCCGCAVLTWPHAGYRKLMGNAVLYARTVEEMRAVLTNITDKPAQLAVIRQKAFAIAGEKMDYVKLARRICREEL